MLDRDLASLYEVETKILQETYNQWVSLEGQKIPFVYLRRDFVIKEEAPEQSQVIKILHDGHDVGLVVDKIIGEYQAVLKPLGIVPEGLMKASWASIPAEILKANRSVGAWA